MLWFLAVPAASVDPDKWDLITHQEIVPQQSFPVEDYTITLADREKNGPGDYTAVVYIEYNGNKQTELMRDGDAALFDVSQLQLEYVGTQDDKQVFNAYHEKSYPYASIADVPKNASGPVTGESMNMSTHSELPTMSLDKSNLMVIGALILLVGFRKR